jgi:hypothetical protein
MCAALAMLALSAAWPSLAPRESYWSEEDQRSFSEAVGHAHELEMRSLSGRRTSAEKHDAMRQEAEAAKRHLDSQIEKLESAQTRSQWTPRILFWLGVSLAVAGLAAYRLL